jgi:actin-related protein 3
MGFSGNVEPQYIIPTVLATRADEGGVQRKMDGVEDLDFYVGKPVMRKQLRRIHVYLFVSGS